MIGIGFLLIATIFVKGVQESERNYLYITQDFKIEVDLQNIADSALVEAMYLIKQNQEDRKENPDIKELVPKRLTAIARRHSQYKIPLQINYDADVTVVAEYGKYIDSEGKEIGNIQLMEREHKSGNVINDKLLSDTNKSGIILISVASRETDNGKVYRRALGYFLEDDNGNLNDKEIYFMNSL